MFAMCGLLMRGEEADVTDKAFDYADAFMQSRVNAAEQGIAAIKPRKKYERKSTD